MVNTLNFTFDSKKTMQNDLLLSRELEVVFITFHSFIHFFFASDPKESLCVPLPLVGKMTLCSTEKIDVAGFSKHVPLFF